MVLLSVLLLAVVSPRVQAGMMQDRRPCTSVEKRLAREAASKPLDWDALYRMYKRYGKCEDIDAAEASSEAVARLLVGRWETLPRLHRLSSDPGFRTFVLGHINATLDMKDVQRIGMMAAESCPSGLRPLCADIGKRAEAAKAEDASYRKRK